MKYAPPEVLKETEQKKSKLHYWFVSVEIWNGSCYGKGESYINATLPYLSEKTLDNVKLGFHKEYNIPIKDINISSISYLGEMTQKEWEGE